MVRGVGGEDAEWDSSIGRPAHDHGFLFWNHGSFLFGLSKSSSARCNKARNTRDTKIEKADTSFL